MRRRAALVGHVQEIDAGHLLEHLAREVRAGAGAGGGEGVFAGVGLGQRDQFGNGAGGKVEPRHQEVRHRPQHGDAGEILGGIERQLGVERRRDRVRGDRVEADRVAVGGRLGDDVGADIAARARAVLDDELLAGQLTELGADDAGECVGRPAGRKDHDVAHRPARPVVGRAGNARGNHGGGEHAAGESERTPAPQEQLCHLECAFPAL